MKATYFYTGYAVLATFALTAWAAWQIFWGKRAETLAKLLFFATVLPFLFLYYVSAVAYLSLRELPAFLKDSLVGTLASGTAGRKGWRKEREPKAPGKPGKKKTKVS